MKSMSSKILKKATASTILFIALLTINSPTLAILNKIEEPIIEVGGWYNPNISYIHISDLPQIEIDKHNSIPFNENNNQNDIIDFLNKEAVTDTPYIECDPSGTINIPSNISEPSGEWVSSNEIDEEDIQANNEPFKFDTVNDGLLDNYKELLPAPAFDESKIIPLNTVQDNIENTLPKKIISRNSHDEKQETINNSYSSGTRKIEQDDEKMENGTDNNRADIDIDVFEVNKGNKTRIYSGKIGDYSGGIFSNLDFSQYQFAVIYDWDNDGALYIVPSEGVKKKKINLRNLTNNSPISIAPSIKMNGVNIGERGLRIVDKANVECAFSITNTTNDDQSVTIILATYTDDGCLSNIQMVSTDVEANDSENIGMFYLFDADNEATGKLMYWNSIAGMMPLKTNINFSQNSGINAYHYDANNRLIQIDKIDNTSTYFEYDNMGNLLRRTGEEINED